MKRLITSGVCAATALLGVTSYQKEEEKTAVAVPTPILQPVLSADISEVPTNLGAETYLGEADDSPVGTLTVSRRSAPLSRPELVRRAQAVENEANRELDRLVRTLGLTESQQDYVFAALAQTSPLFGDSMQVDPENTAALVVADLQSTDVSREEMIYDLLDPEQQDAYADDILDQQSESEAWWIELVEEIESDLAEETPVIPSVPVESVPVESVPVVVPEEPVGEKSKIVTDLDFLTS